MIPIRWRFRWHLSRLRRGLAHHTKLMVVSRLMGTQAVEPLVRVLCRRPCPPERVVEQVESTLFSLGGTAVGPLGALLECAAQENPALPPVAVACMRNALGRIATPAAVELLADAVRESPSDGADLVQPLLHALRRHAGSRRRRSRQVWDACVAALAAIGPDAVKPMAPFLSRAVSSSESDPTDGLREALVQMGPAAVERLESLIQEAPSDSSLSADGMRSVVNVLGRIGTPEAARVLADVAGDPSFADECRAEAMHCLGRLKQPGAAALALRLLSRADSPQRVRQQCIATLGKLGDAQAVEPLIAVLESDSAEPCLRHAAARALGELGFPQAVEPLIAVLLADSAEASLRTVAASALGGLADSRAREPLARVVNEVAGAAEALMALGDPRGLDWFLRRVGESRAGKERLAAAKELVLVSRKLRCSPYPCGTKDLSRFRCAEDAVNAKVIDYALATPHNRLEAALVLADAGDPRAIQPLVDALGAGSFQRRKMARALAKLGRSEWEDLVRGEEEDFRRLADSGTPEALTALHVALDRQGAAPMEARAAAFALARIGDPRGMAVLRRMIEARSDVDDVQDAALALAKIRDAAGFAALHEMLADGGSGARAFACRAYGELGEERFVDTLAKAMSDDAAVTVRHDAAKALEKLGWQPTSESDILQHLVASGRYREAADRYGAEAAPLILRGSMSEATLKLVVRYDTPGVRAYVRSVIVDRSWGRAPIGFANSSTAWRALIGAESPVVISVLVDWLPGLPSLAKGDREDLGRTVVYGIEEMLRRNASLFDDGQLAVIAKARDFVCDSYEVNVGPRDGWWSEMRTRYDWVHCQSIRELAKAELARRGQ